MTTGFYKNASLQLLASLTANYTYVDLPRQHYNDLYQAPEPDPCRACPHARTVPSPRSKSVQGLGFGFKLKTLCTSRYSGPLSGVISPAL